MITKQPHTSFIPQRIVQVLRQNRLRLADKVEENRANSTAGAWDPAIDRWLNEGGAEYRKGSRNLS